MMCTMMFNTVHLTKMYHQHITLQQGGDYPVWICLYYTSNLLTLSEIGPELVNGSDSMCWPAHHAVVAQLAAHPTCIRKVPGSNPGYSTFSDNLIYEVNCLAMKCTMMFNTVHLTKMYHQQKIFFIKPMVKCAFNSTSYVWSSYFVHDDQNSDLYGEFFH